MSALAEPQAAETWLPVFRRICDVVQATVADVWGSAAARELQGTGAGGDGTVYIDTVAEDVVLRMLQAEADRGLGFQLVSEEVGERTFGGGGDVIVVDPIDGSHNAKMGIPYFSITLAAARDRTFGSVYEACVRNLVTGDHYEARLGGGATARGETLRCDSGATRVNVLQVEATGLPGRFFEYEALMGEAEKIRMLGSAALNICLVASGAVTMSLAPGLRSVDAAAALLILSEAGGVACDYEGGAIGGVEMGLDQRTSVVSAANETLMRGAVASMRAARAARA